MAPLRQFAWPGYAALGFAVALALAWPAAVEAAMWWPLLASLVVLGLPHGAVDHLVPARIGSSLASPRFVAGYAALVLLGLALWWIAPAAGLAVFLLVAALHWGSGDVWFARHLGGRAPFRARWRLVAFTAARGLLPVGLPLLAFPREAAEGTGAILGAVGGDAAGWAPSGALRAGGLALLVLACGLALLASALDHRGARRDAGELALLASALDHRGARRDAGELALLAVTFAVVPPVFAVGLYFVTWHALRHVARLMVTSPEQASLLARGRVAAALLAWHREAVPLTAVSLAGLLVLAASVWRVPASATAITGAALALIAALTLPHALVVAAMDRAEWVRSRGGPAASGAPV